MYNRNAINSVSKILRENRTNYWTGNEGKKFEKDFSRYVGNRYSIAVSNGSVALEIALKALDLPKGSSVIVTPRSFIISASCVLNLGLEPIFADVDDNGNLIINEIVKVFKKNVKAIVLVHLNGKPCDLDPIVKFVKKNKIFLIEDCSQAHGALYKGKPVGSFGDVSTWSFCQDKIISTGGEGGMISTSNKNIWKACWSSKDHGKELYKVIHKKTKKNFRWLHDHLGSNYRMTEMQASLGRYQLKDLDNQVKKRNQIANLYIEELKEYFVKSSLFKKFNFKYSKSCRHAFYRLNFFIIPKKKVQSQILDELQKKNIQCGVGSCPEIYLEKIFKKLKAYPKKRLPNAKLLGETSIMFPINPYKSLSQIKKEILVIKNVLKKFI